MRVVSTALLTRRDPIPLSSKGRGEGKKDKIQPEGDKSLVLSVSPPFTAIILSLIRSHEVGLIPQYCPLWRAAALEDRDVARILSLLGWVGIRRETAFT